MGKPTYNWAAAFVAFVNNHPLQEIADGFGIPLQALENRSKAERWESLRTELPLGTCEPLQAVPGITVGLVGPSDPFLRGKGLEIPQSLPIAVQKKLEGLMANRQLNFTQASNLRTYLDQIISKLLDGSLKMEQVFHNKGQIVRTTREISPADLVNIATFARTIHDMTYKALGDTTAQTEKGQDGQVGSQSAAPQIIINLPSAIAQPRQQAAMLEQARKAGIEVIDVPGVVSEELPEPPAMGG
jgi:hypothetical protein